MQIDYHNRIFAGVTNTDSGQVTASTTFHYYQEGDVMWAIYEGGEIQKGTMTGRVAKDGALDFAYQHVDMKGQIRTGSCQSVPEILADGRIRLHETWQWTNGGLESGSSIVEEIASNHE